MKNILGKLGGFILLAGIVFGLFVIIFVPIEMYMKAEAETWPSRKAVVTMSYPRHMAGSGAGRHASGPFWKAEVCGKFLDNDEKFCAARIRYGGFRVGANRPAPRRRSLIIRWDARSMFIIRRKIPGRPCSKPVHRGGRCISCWAWALGSCCCRCSCGFFENASSRNGIVTNDSGQSRPAVAPLRGETPQSAWT